MKKSIYFLIITLIMLVIPNFSFGETLPSEPILLSTMTKVDESGNTVTDDWYDYENGKWAHSKTQDGTIWVWVPRFTYKVDGYNIRIKWSNSYETDDITDGYLRHPAFYFGGYNGGDPNTNGSYDERNGARKELSGFWVQKDLASDKKNFNDALDSCINMTANTSYGLSPAGTYTHLIKASEWGAIAYLTRFMGKDGINYSDSQYVAAIVGNENSLDGMYCDFIDLEGARNTEDVANSRLKDYDGFATYETRNIGTDSRKVPYGENPYFIRGGSLGLFGFDRSSGEEETGYRATISILPEELDSEVAFFDTEADVVAGDYLVIGVDFVVKEDWKFIDENFLVPEGEPKEADVDLELVYGDNTLSTKELNATFLKLVYEKNGVLISEDNKETIVNTTYPSGKYTLQIRTGGTVKINGVDIKVFEKIEDLTAKIVVNQIKLKDSSGKDLKVGNISNNKILLNIYGESGTATITGAILTQAPIKSDNREKYIYSLYEDLYLEGGKIAPVYGRLRGNEIDIKSTHVIGYYDKINETTHIVDYDDITNTSGKKQILLEYKGFTVDQENVKYEITVDNSSLINVTTKTVPEGIGSVLKGDGKYKQKENAEDYPLVALDILNGYKFNKWTYEADTNQIIYNNQNSSTTTFNIPSSNVEITDKDITFIANYLTPQSLRVENQAKEFVVGEEFSLGEKGQLYIDYGGAKEYINLNTPGILVYLDDVLLKEPLSYPVGTKKITIEYNPTGEKNSTIYPLKTSYNIEIVEKKYDLQVEINDINYGKVEGTIVDSNSVQKGSIEVPVNNSTIAHYNVSANNTVTLKATPLVDSEVQGTFIKWHISDSDLVLTQGALDTEEIAFIMPEKELSIEAIFDEGYNITYKIFSAHKEYGDIIYDGKIDEDDEVVQFVPKGQSTKEVEIKPIEGYMFYQWNDRTSINPRKDENITQDKVYTARIIKTYTVEYYDGEELKYKEVVKNNSYSTPPTIGPKDTEENVIDPVTKGYILEGWKKDGLLVDIEEYKITEDTKFYASWVPRIEIIDPRINSFDYISARIKGNSIKYGTLKYIIADTTDKLEDYIEIISEIENSEGSWKTGSVGFQSKEGLGAIEDSSSTIVISSDKETEIVNFSYILSASENSELGFTINGERVIFEQNSLDWTDFSKEVKVKDGKIIIGISYSQPELYKGTDYAAIKDIRLENRWTVISNDYRLYVPKLYENNYIHVKGTGVDNNTVYYKVSELLQKRTTTNYTQEDIDNSNGLLVAIGATDPLYVVAKFNEDFSEVTITKNGENSDGIIADYEAYVSTGKSCMTQNKETLTFAIIEDGVTNIGKALFAFCSKLSTVELPDSLTAIGVAAFRDTGVTNLVIPNSVNSIGVSAFESSSLKNVTISNNITEIANYAFSSCKLTSVVIPYGVQTIGIGAFRACKFTEVTIPNSVTCIKSGAFENCSNLTDIIFEGTVAEWNEITKSSTWNLYTNNYTIHCTDGDI